MANWLGFTKHQFERMPHGKEAPASLWWYAFQPRSAWADDVAAPESQRVIDAYLHQCARGRSLPAGFENKLAGWLQDLSREHPIKQGARRKLYWTIPAYARAHRMNPYTFCKRFREMEKIARKLFPHRVPGHRKGIELSEQQTQEIRRLYLQGQDAGAIADKFGIKPFRVGQLCRAERKQRMAEREKVTPEPSETSGATEYPF